MDPTTAHPKGKKGKGIAPRTQNFSQAEKSLLIDLVEEHKGVILDKRSGGTTWKVFVSKG